MKAFLPILAFVLIVMLCTVSFVLYLNMDYFTSGIMIIIFVVGITLWIDARIKQNETE